jgi:hypothetical protein
MSTVLLRLSTVVAVAAGALWPAPSVAAPAVLTQVSADPYTDTTAQHATQVEPDTFAHGDTIVGAFQVGRRPGSGPGSGSSNIGFVTSDDRGRTWRTGVLPGTTVQAGGPYAAISDPAVGYDEKHDTWLISALGLGAEESDSPVLTSRSTDGGRTWSAPVVTVAGSTDKNWVVCDNTTNSPYYGNCYTQVGLNELDAGIVMSTSSDGGRTWSPALAPADEPHGSSGQPVVQPDGTVVVPYLINGDTEMRAFRSTDGGASWTATEPIAAVHHHIVNGELREFALPTAEVDATGVIYLVWADCAFRSGCPGNDLVLSTSRDGVHWTRPVRIPGASGGPGDHFVPGLGVDRTTAGRHARLGLTFYRYRDADCDQATCELYASYLSSTNGGRTWSAPVTLAGPMRLTWLPNTHQGRMFGQYISTSVLSRGNAFPVIPVAHEPRGGSEFDVAMHVPAGGLPVTGGPHPAR